MDLRNTRVVIRPRSGWEAIDLGMRMATEWYWPMLLSWLVVTLPVFALLQGLLPWRDWLPLLVFWWLKPWWERLPLYILSRALFGEVPSVRETVKAWPRQLARSPLAFLLYRIDTRRSMLLPMRVLENPRGRKHSQRVRQLCQEDTSPGVWLTIIGAHLESFLFLSAHSLVLVFFPEQFDGTVAQFLSTLEAETGFFNNNWLFYASMTVVAPFYVACGFSLYINRRINLEGWDLEITFRQMAERRKETGTAGSKVATSMLAGLLLFASLLQPIPPASAAEGDPQLTPDTARELITTTLEGEDFHEISINKVPRLKEDSNLLRRFIDWLFDKLFDQDEREAGNFGWFASLIEVLLWTALFALIALLIYHYRHWFRAFLTRQPTSTAKAEAGTLGYLDEQTGKHLLPDDISAQCRQLWQEKHHHGAIALLYRASVQVYADSREEPIPQSATESDCLRLVQRELGRDKAAYFRDISRMWIFLAYGQVIPGEDDFSQLCEEGFSGWRQLLSPPQDGGNPS